MVEAHVTLHLILSLYCIVRSDRADISSSEVGIVLTGYWRGAKPNTGGKRDWIAS
jgi:hypothetical protein